MTTGWAWEVADLDLLRDALTRWSIPDSQPGRQARARRLLADLEASIAHLRGDEVACPGVILRVRAPEDT